MYNRRIFYILLADNLNYSDYESVICIVLPDFMGLGRYGSNGGKNFIDQNYVEVTGTAELEIVPDEIYLRIVISEKDKGKKVWRNRRKKW